MHLKNKKNLISFIKLARMNNSHYYWVDFYNDFDWSIKSSKRKDVPGRLVARINLFSLADHGWFNFGLHITILLNLWAIERLIISQNIKPK
jgi:hypothetical protein